ncbi:hypothetical protein Tco_0945826, partial [Tanacetum coccineum]
MITFLKNQGGYKVKSFKKMSYDEIRPIFEKLWDQVHLFVPMDTEDKEKKSVTEQEESAKEEDVKPEQIVKEVCKKSEGKRRKSLARKRARETEDEETSKKQKFDEKEAADYEKEKEELRMWLTVVLDEEEIMDPE